MAWPLVLPLVGLVELGLEHRIARAVPEASDWDRIAKVAAEMSDPEAPIVATPPWIEPHLRARLGGGSMPLPHVARADVSRYARAVEVSLGGDRGSELASFGLDEERELGRFR